MVPDRASNDASTPGRNGGAGAPGPGTADPRRGAAPANLWADLLRGVVDGLAERRASPGPDADGDLLARIGALREIWDLGVRAADPDVVPPRRVGSAMACALFTQPHLATTLSEYHQAGTEDVHEPEPIPVGDPVSPNPEVLEAAFGIPQWELDDFRDEIDRRAGRVLKQARAAAWIWSRYHMPQAGVDSLVRALFPAVTALPGRIGIVRRGPQIYVLCDHSPTVTESAAAASALFLPWVPGPPLVFDPRRVDLALREELGRGIGAGDEELCELLAAMVVVVPRLHAIRWISHDAWRSRGHAALSAMGARYRPAPWLCRSLLPEEVDPTRWWSVLDGKIVLGDVEGHFGLLARQRAEAACRVVYAELLARVSAEPAGDALPVREDLELYDAAGWLEPCLAPLPGWALSSATRDRLAWRSQLPAPVVEAALEEVAARWEAQIERIWIGRGSGISVGTALTGHLIRLHASLRRLLRAPPDPRGNHRDALLMFVAHDLAEARIDRLWVNGWADVSNPAAPLQVPEDLAGTAFWGAWLRVLTQAAQDGATLY